MKNRLTNVNFLGLINVGKVIEKDKLLVSFSVVDDSGVNSNICGLGIKTDDRLIAHVLFSVENEISEIHSLAVDPFFRSLGWGKTLLCGAFTYSLSSGCSICLLQVRVSNYTAIALYEKQNFFVERLLKDYYNRPREDGLEMVCYLE